MIKKNSLPDSEYNVMQFEKKNIIFFLKKKYKQTLVFIYVLLFIACKTIYRLITADIIIYLFIRFANSTKDLSLPAMEFNVTLDIPDMMVFDKRFLYVPVFKPHWR